MQEHTRTNTKDGSSSKTDDEENCALASKAKKGKGKESHSKSYSFHGGKKKGMLKVKCFNYHELGNFATNSSLKKSKKKSSGGVAGEALDSQFKSDFNLIACKVSSMMDGVWYLDIGASFHMTGDKEVFSDLKEKDLHMHIEMGDYRRYSATRLGMVTFQREHGAPLTLRDVMYVPGLKKNLVLVAMLEDRGFDVVFRKGNVLVRCIAMGQVKEIEIQVKNLYKLEVEDYVILSKKE